MVIRLYFVHCLIFIFAGLLIGCQSPILRKESTVIVDSSCLRLAERIYNASTIERVVMTGKNTPTMIRFLLDRGAICCVESDDFSLSIENALASKGDNAVKEILIINDVRHNRWMIWLQYENGTKRLYHEYSYGKISEIQELRLGRMKDVVITVRPNWYDW